MNKSTLKIVLYIAIGLIIFSAVVSLFFWLLPYLLGGGILIYLAVKVYGFFKKDKGEGTTGYTYNSYNNTRDDVYSEDTVDTSKAIDVDYKEVDE